MAYWKARFNCCTLLFGLIRTIDTKRRSRIKIQALYVDGLLAGLAITELVAFDAAERRPDLSQHLLASLRECLRHRLRLHGIHAGKTPDFRLIQFDHCGKLVAGRGNGLELDAQREQFLPYLLIGIRVHRFHYYRAPARKFPVKQVMYRYNKNHKPEDSR